MKSIKESIIGRKGFQNIKQSLRNGDVVESRHGIYSIYIQDDNVFWSGFGPNEPIGVINQLNAWDENLHMTYTSGTREDPWDIVKIYRKPANKIFHKKSSLKELNEYVEWIKNNVKPINNF